ncbi:MAG TPA: tRNA epoxyqueuosine(34) reductase QueG [Salinivirgaceae bacterium]|nr:tRNA epoxyqueuosine(34) reductase QueG [Salinivirgaceae bacterium]
MLDKIEISRLIKQKALELGFDDCGIAEALFYPELKEFFHRWISDGYSGEMSYLSETETHRTNINEYHSGARSVIVLVTSYYPGAINYNSRYKVAKFALVSDYHFVLREQMNKLIEWISQQIPESDFRFSVDAMPIVERFWAVKAGVCFRGQNGMVIHPKLGSHIFLSTITTNISMQYDSPMDRECMGCGECIRHCPNQAIVQPYVVDARRCISYVTIEYRNEQINSGIRLSNYLFGCDICNDVCPHNAEAKEGNGLMFRLKSNILSYTDTDWENLGSAKFKRELSHTPIRRAGLRVLRRNIRRINCEK